jgi:cytochrome d ubiquinol oxidase subunit I
MDDLLAARSQMAMSLAFHIVFAVIGIAMPAMMAVAEWRWIRTGDEVCLALAKRWAKGTAILFPIGAVSGTVLSFELGLLWPEFMEFAGPLIGLPFALEGFAFFTEAIFLGVYLYGWDRIPRGAHFAAGVVVAASGMVSGIFVITANAWMNTPTGFRLEGGRAVDIDPLAAMLNPGAFPQALHMTLAAYSAVGLAVAGVHAVALLRDRQSAFHRRALGIAFVVGGAASLAQLVAGDVAARFVAEYQPIKLAAMEGHFETERGAALSIGGLPDEERRTTDYAIKIPYALSLLAHHDPNAEVLGLEAFPRDQWPNTRIVHIAFQIMVGCGTAMAALALWGAWLWWRRRDLTASTWFLRALAASIPLGVIAIQAGWTVTEVGRQPWIIVGVMRTAEAVTPMPGLAVPFVAFTLLYIGLAAIVVWLMIRQVFGPTMQGEEEARDAVA